MKFRVSPPEGHGNAHWVITFNAWSKLHSKFHKEIETWCWKSFGPANWWDTNNNLSPRWIDDLLWGEICFRDEKDVTMFILRWS
jgi:hypothetical protein